MTTHLDLQMQAFNEAWAAHIAAGQAAMPDEVRAVVDGLKVGERLTVELGRIEQANAQASLDLARGKADAFLSSALAYDDLRKVDDWKLLDRHIDKRANARRSEIQKLS